MDRKDLDSQTIAEFEKGSVDTTDKTDKLVEQTQDMTKPLILTTIQKMANAAKNSKYSAIFEQYQDERVIFILDECHRSQFGKMHTAISHHYKFAQYFVFTGTPRFEENLSYSNYINLILKGC